MAVVSTMTINLLSGMNCNTPHCDDDSVLDPRKDYRLEIYNMLQYLDEQQEKIEQDLRAILATSKSSASSPTYSTSSSSNTSPDATRNQHQLDETDEDDFVVVEDMNKSVRRKQLLSQLQQLWRTRDLIRQRASNLNVHIDSLEHGKGSGLMMLDESYLLDSNQDLNQDLAPTF